MSIPNDASLVVIVTDELYCKFFVGYLERINPLCFLKPYINLEKRAESGNIWVPNDLCGERTFFRELMALCDPS